MSEAFLRPVSSGPVFENSAACVYVETLAGSLARSCLGITRRALRSVHFELKLEVKACLPREATIFTESLILAQDERWRRA